MAVEKSSIKNKETCLPDKIAENQREPELCRGVRLYYQV